LRQDLVRVLLVLSICLVAACATPYTQPVASAPHAELHMRHYPVEGLLFGGRQTYFAFNDVCQVEEGTRLEEVSAVPAPGQSPSRTVRIASGKEIYIRTTARGQGTAPAYSCGGQVCMELRECSSYLSFVPEAGKTYDIHQVWTSAGCGTKLIEDPTRLAPASMRFHSERTNLCPPGAKFFKK